MEIISLSVDEETIAKLEEIKEKSSYSGRSELLRKAISDLHDETVDNSDLEGHLNALVVVRHPHAHEQSIGEISHRYDDVITTQLHSKLDGEKCLEVFHVDGKAERAVDFYSSLKGSKDTESVKLLPQS